MSDIVGFLTARIDEDERLARAASPGPWSVDSDSYPEAIVDSAGREVASGSRWGGEASIFASDEDARHIARHGPSRVLDECEAKRSILYQAVGLAEVACIEGREDLGGSAILHFLASPYVDHPDFDPEWAAA